MMKVETLDLELKTFNHTQTERIFLSKNQFEILGVVARALGQTMAEYGVVLSVIVLGVIIALSLFSDAVAASINDAVDMIRSVS